MTMEHEDISRLLWGAREVLAALPRTEVAAALRRLLDRSAATDWADPELALIADEITALVAGDARARRLMREFLDREAASRVSVEPLPGSGRPVPPSARYTCPRCPFEWYRRTVSQPVPRCPKDDLELSKVDTV